MISAILVFTLIFLIGYTLINSISVKFNIFMKIGLGFPLGFGLISFMMMAINFVNLTFSLTTLLSASILVTAVIGFTQIKEKKINAIFNIRKTDLIKLKDVNLAWVFLFSVIVFICYGIITKALFWPTTALDTVTGYDFMAKVVAAEGTFNNTIFAADLPISSIRHSYPPFVSGSFAIPYMVGLKSTKITTVLIFLSLILFFWAIVKERTTQTAAIFFTLVLVCVPEFLAMSALSLTNVPQTLFGTMSLIILNEYFAKKENSYFILATIMLGLNVFTRSDGIVFIFGGGIMLLAYCYQNWKFNFKQYWLLIVKYGAISLSPFILWQLYLNIYIPNSYSSSNAFVKSIFWDGEKLSIMSKTIWGTISSTQLYGYVFLLFVVVLLFNIRNIRRDKPLLLIGMFTSILIFSFLFYQMNNKSSEFVFSLDEMIRSSFKRGLFAYLPGVCFYMATSPVIKRVFTFLYKPLF